MMVPHHNLAVVAPMIIKFNEGNEHDVFYTIIGKSL